MTDEIKTCTHCGHEYIKPCNGDDKKCGNYEHAIKIKEAKLTKANMRTVKSTSSGNPKEG